MRALGSKDDGAIQPGSVRNVTLARGTDGSVGIRFKRPQGVTVGPIEVTSVLPNSAAERSGQLRAGHFFCAIDAHDVSNLDDKAVVELFRGAPSTTYILSLCAGPAEWTRDVSKAFGDKQVSQAIAWATRSGRVQAKDIAEFEVLLRQLGSVSLPHSKVSEEVLIGQGANGSVTMAKMQGEKVAIKHINPNATKPFPQLIREMSLELAVTIEASHRKHPNIVTFLGSVVKFPSANETKDEWAMDLVFELCDPFDCYHLLHNHKIKLTIPQKLRLVRESATGLAYLHSMNILHRDFGSRNLLIKEGHIKITDFGLARKLQAGQECYQPSTVCGTLPWMAPEQIAGKMLSFQSDVFALGTVMWEFLSETVPFSDVHDPLKQDLPTMAIALNTRDISMGGWPYGISSAKGGKIVSITLCPPQHSSLDDLSEDVRRDVNRILALMHQHVSVFRPAADEVVQVLKSVEERLIQSNTRARMNALWSPLSESTCSTILQGLEERIELSVGVANFYQQYDKHELTSLDTHRWAGILSDSHGWKKQVEAQYRASPCLPYIADVSASQRLMLRRSDRLREGDDNMSTPTINPTFSRALAPVLRGCTAVASWCSSARAIVTPLVSKMLPVGEKWLEVISCLCSRLRRLCTVYPNLKSWLGNCQRSTENSGIRPKKKCLQSAESQNIARQEEQTKCQAPYGDGYAIGEG